MTERCTGGNGYCAVIPEFIEICSRRSTNVTRLAARAGYSRGYVISLITAARSGDGVTRVQVERIKELLTAHRQIESKRA
jgi:hypothetical protein